MKNMIVIDAYSFLFRAYYAMPPLTGANNTPVGAIYGFINMLIKCLNDHPVDYIVIACDYGKKTFRNDMYKEYKANRIAPPDDLIPQFSLLRDAVQAFGLKLLEYEGYEADDIIATLVRKYSNSGDIQITIFSSDKDLMQLMNDKVKMYDSIKNKYLTEEYSIEKFGVTTDKLLDVLSLAGDKSDNVPGVPGIGVKTAAQLINEYGDLETLLSRSHEIKQKKRRETMISYAEEAKLSKKLITLYDTIDIKSDLDDYIYDKPDLLNAKTFLQKYNLRSLVDRINKTWENDIEVVEDEQSVSYRDVEMHNLFLKDLDEFITKCRYTGIFSFMVSIDKLNQITEIHMAYDNINSYTIKINNQEDNTLFQDGDDIGDTVIAKLEQLFQDESILKISYDMKKIQHLLGVRIVSAEDIFLMSYTLDSVKHKHELGFLFSDNLSISDNDVRKYPSLMINLYGVFLKKLSENGLYYVYRSLDMPLASILYNMEKEGILVNKDILYKLSKEFNEELKSVEHKIYNLAGREFNIASPKQLSVVLFDEMQIDPASKKRSTDISVLEEIELKGHNIATHIIRWRHLSKLINTYVDALLKQVNSATGRIHTTYSMASTSTSRLSSHDPNLQNIPIRTEDGNRIREAFIAKEGCLLLSADYSQIELCILANIANITPLKEALRMKKDIHSVTASQIFNVELSEVTSDLRRKAKAINFGIIYGISPFGLSKQLSISVQEAKHYIDYYFSYYPGIQEYMNNTKIYAAEHGYVKTMQGRQCCIRDINSSNYQIRAFAERAAINAPLQGTAADIMRDAIIQVNNNINKDHANILLQVHDEMILEVKEDHIDSVIKIVKKYMENIAIFDVSLSVDINVGKNWMSLK